MQNTDGYFTEGMNGKKPVEPLAPVDRAKVGDTVQAWKDAGQQFVALRGSEGQSGKKQGQTRGRGGAQASAQHKPVKALSASGNKGASHAAQVAQAKGNEQPSSSGGMDTLTLIAGP
jgi:hypothetical protein